MVRKDLQHHSWCLIITAVIAVTTPLMNLTGFHFRGLNERDWTMGVGYLLFGISTPMIIFLIGITLFQDETWKFVRSLPRSNLYLFSSKVITGLMLLTAMVLTPLGCISPFHVITFDLSALYIFLIYFALFATGCSLGSVTTRFSHSLALMIGNSLALLLLLHLSGLLRIYDHAQRFQSRRFAYLDIDAPSLFVLSMYCICILPVNYLIFRYIVPLSPWKRYTAYSAVVISLPFCIFLSIALSVSVRNHLACLDDMWSVEVRDIDAEGWIYLTGDPRPPSLIPFWGAQGRNRPEPTLDWRRSGGTCIAYNELACLYNCKSGEFVQLSSTDHNIYFLAPVIPEKILAVYYDWGRGFQSDTPFTFTSYSYDGSLIDTCSINFEWWRSAWRPGTGEICIFKEGRFYLHDVVNCEVKIVVNRELRERYETHKQEYEYDFSRCIHFLDRDTLVYVHQDEELKTYTFYLYDFIDRQWDTWEVNAENRRPSGCKQYYN